MPIGKEYVAPKDWNDITDSEKIERMREIIKGLSSNVSRLQSDLRTLKNSFKNHAYVDGKIVEPYNEYGNDNSVGTALLSNYF